MTAATLLRLPVSQEAADRMALQARKEAIRTACLDVLHHHAWHSQQAIEDAWVNLAQYGTDEERKIALAKVEELAAPQPETSLEVFMQFKDRWPEIMIYAAIGAAVILAWADWL